MPHNEHLCSHINQVDDVREGMTVCTDCGLVISDKYFLQSDYIPKNEGSEKDGIKDMLEKINIPNCYISDILKNYNAETKKEAKKLPYIIYQTLNQKDCAISIKDISNVTGIADKKLYKMQKNDQVIILKPSKLLEKYCTMFNFNFKTYSVIKEKIPEKFTSGHNPLTIIAAHIYAYSRDNKLKLSMKKIAHLIQISPVSIQRYLNKNAVSFRP